ncbi:N-acetylmuramoyl-L-alanine amidase [Hespellia stercorisuis]|uniref:N-acetylmuramoyl-L-alanine amidase n=1 Tax=Hespellia stercorisuis DSM 15480 TaxID=1121950 RepID=A0A1M6P3P5_9FIRM|nr:N-acetylmuramoyl-L-alanine amidase [Hespellia stercorisuis]SHK02512.1 N-acetylmuramoyl-L-alanine amidase [Hespellia stercorisuis DSM 15480]
MRKKWKYILGMVILAGLIVLEQKAGEVLLQNLSVSSGEVQSPVTVVIDPGHGSSDPGKVGINDLLEKDVNLKIAKEIKKLLEKEGITVVMTREDDSGLGKSKVEDLKARVAVINDTKPALAVSIHQNSYGQEEVKGAQTFYFTHSEKGKEAALILQEKLCAMDSENHRQAKANETYYILKRTEVPTVIVECGFLSNREEAQKLGTGEYQEQIAQAVCSGIHGFITKEE